MLIDPCMASSVTRVALFMSHGANPGAAEGRSGPTSIGWIILSMQVFVPVFCSGESLMDINGSMQRFPLLVLTPIGLSTGLFSELPCLWSSNFAFARPLSYQPRHSLQPRSLCCLFSQVTSLSTPSGWPRAPWLVSLLLPFSATYETGCDVSAAHFGLMLSMELTHVCSILFSCFVSWT